MKKYIDCLCLCVLLAVCCVACQEEEDASAVRSGFLISLVEAPQVGVEARTIPKELDKPLVENFRLKIVRQPNTPFYDDSFKKEIDASQGTYTLTAYYGDNSLGLDKPYYEGTAEATVSEGLTPVEIKARVANALVSVKYENEALFNSIYTGGYHVDVEVGNQRISLDDITKSVYFPAGSTVKLYFMGKKEGDANYQSYELKSADLPSSFAAGDHAIITLSAQNMGVSIKKAEVTQVEISETIPLEWLPNPKVTVQGFDDNHSLTYYETETPEASLQFTTALGLEELKFKVDFQDATYSSLNGDYTLSAMTEAQKQAFADAGITLPEIGNTEKKVMDFTGLIAKLKAKQNATVDNVITLQEVKANNKTLSADALGAYTISVNAPVFSISVDERNVWSKEFTIDEVVVTQGNEEVVKDGIVYQYSNGDDVWTDCSDGRLQKFVEHPENRSLFVRAKFRDFVSESVPVEMEEPVQMPNSDMEEWHYSSVARDIITYYPWESGGSAFWNTNNPYTTRYVSSTGLLMGSYPYNCFPAVSYIVGGHSGNRAVEIRSTASGRGNTLPSNVLELNKVAGELYVGEDIFVKQGGTSARPVGDYYTIDLSGREFTSRPTSLHFWYKYAPLNSDTWRAYIVLMDANHNTIIEQELQESVENQDWCLAKLDFNYLDNQLYEKCKFIYVVFSSTITTGNSMQWKDYESYTLWKDDNPVTFDGTKCWIGSILTIDDISLIYDK